MEGWRTQRDFQIIVRALDCVDDKAEVMFLNDIHIGSEGTDIDYVEEKLKREAKKPNLYFGLGGDFIDNGIKSSKAGPYHQTMMPREQKKTAVRLFSHIRDKILYILPGNHEAKSAQEVDDNPAYDIAAKLDLEDVFRESIAIARLDVGKDTDHNRPWRYYLASVHGAGGGIYTGGAINKTENFLYGFDGIDVLVTGHVHKLAGSRPGKLVVDGPRDRIIQKDMLVMISGAWCDYVAYAAEKMYRPGPRKPARVTFFGDRRDFEGTI
jgi:hypothetical protein